MAIRPSIPLRAGLAVALSAAAVGCGEPARREDSLKLGGYSVVREVFHEGIIPAFKNHWRERTGREPVFGESYSSSGAQARSIASGFDADVAALSHPGDMELLVKAGKVAPTWKDGPNRGILTHSLVVIGHRDGNPKGIKDWSDLAAPGVALLYPDPKTSGGARWNVNAIYGAALLKAGAGAPVRDLMEKIQANVVNMDPSGRRSLANFARSGDVDAVVTYENELLLRAREKEPIPYVVPPATLLIESPFAIVGPSVDKHGNRELVEAFVEFLSSAEAQTIFVDYGFRPLDSATEDAPGRPEPAEVFTIDDLGGWKKVADELYSAHGLWTATAARVVTNRRR